MDAEKLAKDCEERAIIFDGADAIFLAQHERECAKVIKNLIDRTESAEARAETLEKMVKEYQEVIVPGYREQAEKAERERDEEKLKVDEYAGIGTRYCNVAPVIRAKWISFLDGESIMPERYYRCSKCGRVEKRKEPYCHCGAKMDGETK